MSFSAFSRIPTNHNQTVNGDDNDDNEEHNNNNNSNSNSRRTATATTTASTTASTIFHTLKSRCTTAISAPSVASPVTLLFYVRHSFQEASRHKCNCFLGAFSVLSVVIIAALCYTLVDNAPVVFFRQAEQIYGQYDVRVQPQSVPLMNYSLANELLSQSMPSRRSFFSAPRVLWNETNVGFFLGDCFEAVKERYYQPQQSPPS